MTNDEDKKEGKQPKAPYLPFKTFFRLIQTFKGITVPQRIDTSALNKFSGSDIAALLPALKFLGLIDKNQMRTPKLDQLVEAYETPGWKSKFREMVIASYAEIINGLNVGSATRRQLEEQFRNAGTGVLEKCIRFYIAAADEADIPLSPFITMRQKAKGEKRTQKTKQERTNEEFRKFDSESEYMGNPQDFGFKEFTLPIRGKQPVKILIPEDITQSEWESVRKMMAPITEVIQTYFGFSLGINAGE